MDQHLENTGGTLKKFWTTLSGWNDIMHFGKVFFFILRKPFRHTIQIYKTIEAEDSFKFFVQSFIIFTIITSLFTAFRGNDILKSILLMLNQLFFLTLSTLLYYFLFSKMSETKRSFNEFLTLYSLYMGFILPFFAIGSLLNWQVVLMITDPALRYSSPNPVKALSVILGSFSFVGFGFYYCVRITRYFWNINIGQILLGMGLVFILLTPLQRLWLQGQCSLGITPDFEFNSLAHRKGTLEILGCAEINCRKCLITGKWKYSEHSIIRREQQLIANFIDVKAIENEISIRKAAKLEFQEDGHFIYEYRDTSPFFKQNSSLWFVSEDGKQIYFDNYAFDILSLSKDSVVLSFEINNQNSLSKLRDTITLESLKINLP